VISTLCLCADAGRSHEQAGDGRASIAPAKPSVSAAADDRFAQFDVVGLTIALATNRSSPPSPSRSGRSLRNRPGASDLLGRAGAIALDESNTAAAADVGHLLFAPEAGADSRRLGRLGLVQSGSVEPAENDACFDLGLADECKHQQADVLHHDGGGFPPFSGTQQPSRGRERYRREWAAGFERCR
jgi:hypothetical protein